ncbi:hypothetical protein [Nitrospirillum sp. BR 11163]|uniref:hypothetical protein n=1 Tax=Nitrospirillum sp. BR 11163 TaxID=3104323 RepID=UPI002AFEE243|nr:hypothetical protein [Nitrospirillum sp. BR 11163]MEA1676766.1 hypothetical protein [Nitrospirillum sp. BR 11163]
MTIVQSIRADGTPAADRSWLRDALVLLVLTAAMLTRDRSWVVHPALWAEDGMVWFKDVYDHGLAALFMPHAGYQNLYQHLIAMLGLALPLAWLPGWFLVGGAIAQMLPVAVLLHRGAEIVPSPWARAALILFYVGIPNSQEIHLNLTNTQWHLSLVLFLLLVLTPPAGWLGRAAHYTGLMVSALTGPFSIFLAPVALWRGLRPPADRRREERLKAALVCAVALVQVVYVVWGLLTVARETLPLGVGFTRLARMLADQLFLAGILGARTIWDLRDLPLWRQSVVAWVVVPLALAMLAMAFRRGPAVFRQFLAFGVLTLAAGLVAPVGPSGVEQWGMMDLPGIYGRYFFLPMMVWFTGLVVLAAQGGTWLRWVALLLLPLCLIGVCRDWLYQPKQDVHEAYRQAVRDFEAAPPGTTIKFPEASPGWTMDLTKR